MTSLKVRWGNHSLRSTWTCDTAPQTEWFSWVLAAGGVLVLHALLVGALLMAPPPKKLSLMSTPATPTSVRVTMLPATAPQIEPEITPTQPPAPPVMTSEKAERIIAPIAPEPAKVTKRVAKPVKPQKPIPPQPPAPEVAKDEPIDAAARAQTAAPDPTVEKNLQPPASGPKDVTSVGCRVPPPEYPRKAKRLGIEGQTLISIVVSPQGKIEQANIARSSGNTDLDSSARQAVLAASCTPYIEGGRAVAVRAVQPINFSLTR